MARLFANEDFPFPVVRELRRYGHDVIAVHDIGKSNQGWPDPELLAHARSEGRAVLSLNRLHFRKLHRLHPDHAGIVICTVDGNFNALARRIHEAIAATTDLRGQLIRIYKSDR